MPNHVKTIVRLTGDKKQINTLIETHINNKEFDFASIIHMPKNIFKGNLGQEEKRIHGENNWYDWSIKNWGTKWNSYNFNQFNNRLFSFSTAWAFPFPVIEKLSVMYPDVKLHISYADEDIGYNCGKFTIENNVTKELEITDTVSFARRVWNKK